MSVWWRRFSVRQEADEPPESSPDSVSVSGIRPRLSQHFDGHMLEHVRSRKIITHAFNLTALTMERHRVSTTAGRTYEVRWILYRAACHWSSVVTLSAELESF